MIELLLIIIVLALFVPGIFYAVPLLWIVAIIALLVLLIGYAVPHRSGRRWY